MRNWVSTFRSAVISRISASTMDSMACLPPFLRSKNCWVSPHTPDTPRRCRDASISRVGNPEHAPRRSLRLVRRLATRKRRAQGIGQRLAHTHDGHLFMLVTSLLWKSACVCLYPTHLGDI